MHASRFDAFSKALAVRTPRRGALKVLAGLGLGGVLLRRAAEPAAAAAPKCPVVTCPAGFCQFCEITSDFKKCACGCGECFSSGIAGGGTVSLDGGDEAHVSLLATRTRKPDQPNTFVVVGQLRWFDAAADGGLTLDGAVTSYGPQSNVEGGREVAGWIKVNGEGQYPFVLHAVDAGPPGGGKDTVALWVGDALLDTPELAGTPWADQTPTGFGYVAQGALVSGDLQLLSLASPMSVKD